MFLLVHFSTTVTVMPALVHQLVYMAKFGGLNPRILHDLKLEIYFYIYIYYIIYYILYSIYIYIYIYTLYSNIDILDRNFLFLKGCLLEVFCYLT